ncbi:toprim domain-containing protein [Salinisphaera orenii]|uniref:Topoisomerase n=1 Tax=Salinisphaera orenii YIM 95161 TaxID=1051139 RepID=A0A423PIV0_9GAMM|nr:toprim domain-containing protein [Salinisphaera halophila]ROO25507.1 topoisomerase [Salinisphaera halophila YIM 95161]
MSSQRKGPAPMAVGYEAAIQNAHYSNHQDTRSALIGAMAAAGVCPSRPAEIVLDGSLHRFHVDGDRRGRLNGWLVGFDDEHPAAKFGSWKTGLVRSWRSDRYTPMSEAERADIAQQQAERRQRRERAHKAAAERASRIWQSSRPADPSHRYLQVKRVQPHSARQQGDRLVLPLFDFERRLHSLQFIGEAGDKKLLRDGRKRGCFIPVAGRMPAERVLIAEGFATCCTLAEIEPESLVLAAVDAGNLESVAVGARQRMPHAEIVVCADADPIGESKARTAAHRARAFVSVPEFPPGVEGSDYNDLHAGVAYG